MPSKSFCGIPITGEINGTYNREDQLSENDYANLVRPLLEDPNIVKFGWVQFTPYFNDGDTCYFGVGELWVETIAPDGVVVQVSDGSEEDEYEDYYTLREKLSVSYNTHPTLGASDGTPMSGFEGTAEKARALSKAMNNGSLNDVLFDLFGDHAEVTVHKNGIIVDYYDHE